MFRVIQYLLIVWMVLVYPVMTWLKLRAEQAAAGFQNVWREAFQFKQYGDAFGTTSLYQMDPLAYSVYLWTIAISGALVGCLLAFVRKAWTHKVAKAYFIVIGCLAVAEYLAPLSVFGMSFSISLQGLAIRVVYPVLGYVIITKRIGSKLPEGS